MPNQIGVSSDAPPAAASAVANMLRKKTKALRDPDYHAAWLACRKPWISEWSGSEIDLRAALDDLLKSGWSIQALKAYAFRVREYARRGNEHVTAGAWRWAVYLASRRAWGQDGPLGAKTFLAEFNANPECYADDSDISAQAAGMSA
jgi:hypothetical protein